MGTNATLLVTGSCCLFQEHRGTTGRAKGAVVAQEGQFCRIDSPFGSLCQHAGLTPCTRVFPTGGEWQLPLPSWDLSFLTRRAHVTLLPRHALGSIPAISSVSAWQTLAPMQARGPWDAWLP